MAKSGTNRQTDDLRPQLVQYGTWMEWFMECKTVHDRFGTPYSDFIPPDYVVEKLGAMPTPPWVTAQGSSGRVR